ncbi:polysaccharide biosynthesis C-terminal domain-containing protein [Pontixanthobacter aestiaquae]|uniref:Oligosaccharide flippase family protein n=1 Tax=Pontixanthobacter aestiaquae TaxID=1509367 RepID=A0A844Z835_9SPHN|nr:polysaccharide biosynthesis C-terminal domain-containing protein [Pontixanthobacter aestiaquae]MDN3646950.1 polysaccharide biosynthesis C-terminal domain-containing protein [Pontixanthobacter aestiaquae]MXO82069.1 oligosaccharide flippase family protein [Pontixanthobacter aestiaquae]
MLRKLITQAASVAGIRVAGTGLSILVSIVIAQFFGAESLGVYGYCVALMAIAAVPISNGQSTLLLRTVAHDGALSGTSKAMAAMGARAAVIFAATAGFLAWVAIGFASTDIAQLLKPFAYLTVGFLALALLCDQISAMRMAAIRGIDRPALAQLPETLIRPLMLLAGLVFVWARYGSADPVTDLPAIFAALAVAAFVSACIGQFILGAITAREKPTQLVAPDRKAWVWSAAALAGSAGLVQLNGYIDLLLLGSFTSAADVGYYRAALQIAMLANFGYIALNMLAGQRFARIRAENDIAGMAKTATTLSRLALLTAIPLPLAIWMFGEPLLVWLFGDGFTASVLPALIISLGLCFSASIGMAHSMLVMSHQEKLALLLTGIALAINVALCLLLIPSFGLIGAALANAAAAICWNGLLWYFARLKTGFDTSIIGLSPRAVS